MKGAPSGRSRRISTPIASLPDNNRVFCEAKGGP